MKSSIFDMNFTLPPLVEMTEVETNGSIFTGAAATLSPVCGPCGGHSHHWVC